jgi:hypothetical protein
VGEGEGFRVRVRVRVRVGVGVGVRVRVRVWEEDLFELLHIRGRDALAEELDALERRHLVVREVIADEDLPARGRGQAWMDQRGIMARDRARARVWSEVCDQWALACAGSRRQPASQG